MKDSDENVGLYHSMVGAAVKKSSGKPFKSALKVNTVTGVVFAPGLDRMCFSFEEDDALIECWRCKRAHPLYKQYLNNVKQAPQCVSYTQWLEAKLHDATATLIAADFEKHLLVY